MTDNAAREIVDAWLPLARQGWEAEHACQHGTTCCSPGRMGPDRVSALLASPEKETP